MDLSEIKKSSLSIEKDLMKKEIKRDELTKQIELKNEEMLEIQSTKDKTNRAGLFLKSKAHDTRKKSCESIDEMITKANGKRTIPQIFFDDQHIGGYDETRALEKENKLQDLLK